MFAQRFQMRQQGPWRLEAPRTQAARTAVWPGPAGRTETGGYPGAGLFCGRRLGGWGGRGGGGALLSEIPGWAGLLCWLKASITLGVFATGGGGVGARGSVERNGEDTDGWTSSRPQPSHPRLL